MIQKKQNKWFSVLKILIGFWILSFIAAAFFSFDSSVDSGNVAIIPIHGIITTNPGSSLGSSGVSSDGILNLLDQANQNPSIKAILLDINSPGGSGVAADEIGQKIQSIDKPVIAVIRDLGASAAYWIATTSDLIYANKLSFTGSIGVIGSYLDFSGLMENYNVTYQRYVSGELKDMGSPFKKPTNLERDVFQDIIDQAKDVFIKEVASNRNMSIKKVEKLATGQIFIGKQAYELGLVDVIGTKEDALNFIETRINSSVDIVEYKNKKSLTELLSELNVDTKIGKFINPVDSLISFK
jgi:protease-4